MWMKVLKLRKMSRFARRIRGFPLGCNVLDQEERVETVGVVGSSGPSRFAVHAAVHGTALDFGHFAASSIGAPCL